MDPERDLLIEFNLIDVNDDDERCKMDDERCKTTCEIIAARQRK